MYRTKARLGILSSPAHFILTPKTSRKINSFMNELDGYQLQIIHGPLKEQQFAVILYHNAWVRAIPYKPSRQLGNSWLHFLMLIDKGITVSTDKVYNAPRGIFENSRFAAYEFFLDCVVPKNGKWDPDVTQIVEEKLKEEINFEVAVSRYHDDVLVFGDIYLGNESLSDFLIQNAFADSVDGKKFSEIGMVSCIYGECLKNGYKLLKKLETECVSSDEDFYSCESEEDETLSKISSTDSETKFYQKIPKNRQIEPMQGSYNFLIRKPKDEPPLHAVTNLSDSTLSEDIARAMKKAGIRHFRPISAYMIPNFPRGRNMAVIGTHNGKTWSSIICVMNQLLTLSQDNVPSGNGPMAIFLCEGSKTAYDIERDCKYYAERHRYKFIPRVLSVLGSNEKDKKALLMAGCDVLITTPFCLVRLLRQRNLTNIERLRWLIIDKADEILKSPYNEEMDIIRMIITPYASRLQFVVLSNEFTPNVWQFIKSLNNHILLIPCYLEAAFYSQVQLTVAIQPTDKKISYLSEWLQSRRKERIIVICHVDSEVKIVADNLKKLGWAPLVADNSEEQSHLKLKAIRSVWNDMNSALLVCCDAVLINLAITNATCLVHYSLPKMFKTAFVFRFSLLLDFYRDHYNPDDPQVPLTSLVLIDEETDMQLPVLVNYLKRMSGNVEVFTDLTQRVFLKKEAMKLDKELCFYMLTRGTCPTKELCNYRHILAPNLDLPDPRYKGEIVFTPSHIENGITIYAKLQSAEDANGNKHNFEDYTEMIMKGLANHFKDLDLQLRLAKPEYGTLCVYLKDDEYYRAKIVHVQKRTKKIYIRLMDYGYCLCVGGSDLKNILEMPDNFDAIPPQAVKMHLAGILPIDYDLEFDGQSTKAMKNLFTQKKLGAHEQWRGCVRFAFKSALIVDNVRIVCFYSNIGEFVDTGTTAAAHLIDLGLAIANKEHITILTGICNKLGFPVPALRDKIVATVKPRWAFLEQGGIPNVLGTLVKDTNHVYVVQASFSKQLTDLEGLCHKEAETLIQNKLKFNVKVGNICLAKTTYGWNRARVETVEEDKAKCYMVDYGDLLLVNLNEIVPISQNLVNRLPFQAIECVLTGVKFCNTDEFIEEIYGYLDRGLFARRDRLIQLLKSNQPQYEITLYTLDGRCINQALINSGIVDAADGVESMENLTMVSDSTDSEIDGSVESDRIEENLDGCRISDEAFLRNLVAEFDDCLAKPKETLPEKAQTASLEKPFLTEVKTQTSALEKTVLTGMKTQTAVLEKPLVTEMKTPKTLPLEYEDECCLVTNPKGLHPLIYWSQTEKTVKIRLMVPAVQSKKVFAIWRHIRVRLTTMSGAEYSANLRLFGVIDYKFIQFKITPASFDISCPKRLYLPWARLTYEEKPIVRVAYDPLCVVADESDKKTIMYNKPIYDDYSDGLSDDDADFEEYDRFVDGNDD